MRGARVYSPQRAQRTQRGCGERQFFERQFLEKAFLEKPF
jgi:hypothetical protein